MADAVGKRTRSKSARSRYREIGGYGNTLDYFSISRANIDVNNRIVTALARRG